MNTIKVLFFATLKEKAGVTEAQLELAEGADVAALKQALFQKFKDLPQAGSSMLVAVNKEYAFDADVLPSGAEVALFPPVSGG
jgi:molybdopterin converting factor subunit 1